MILHSLRWRLLVGAGLAILASLVLAGLFMTLLFARHAERQMVADLTQDGLRLAAAASFPPSDAMFNAALEDPRLSTPASGLYWQVTVSEGRNFRSRSLWDQVLPAAGEPPSDAWRSRLIPGPFGPQVLVVERLMDTGLGPIEVRVAQDAAELYLARQQYGWELALCLTLLWLALAAAAWIQVDLGLRPLADIRTDIERLQRNPAIRLPAGRLSELAPLIEAINALADARAEDMQRARRRAADLAHGLKTPTAALAAQLRRLPADDPAVEGLRRSIAAIRETVEAELTRSRIAITRSDAGLLVRAAPVARQLAAVLGHTERGAMIEIDIDLSEDFAVPVDTADLTEMLGPVLDNAVRHARSRVRVQGQGGPKIRLIIDDDGEGIAGADHEAVLRHGLRLDERQGAGLGLAIAQGIAEASHGAISLSQSPLGGLRVELSWPGAGAP